jgi:DNA-binding transcriptional regulator GbsR (MarR family)
VFSYFTIEDMAATLRKSQTTIKTSLSALEQVDLICRARQGTGNPNRIYVKVPADFSTQTEEKLSVRQSENRPFDRQNSVRQTVRKLSPNNKEKKNNDSVKRHYECKEDESL